MPPRLPPPWPRTIFVDHAPVYAGVLRATIPLAAAQVEGIRRILDRAGVSTGSRILDFACGIGRHIIPLGLAGYEVVGCDLSPGFIREARRWARKERLPSSRARFYVTDYRSLGRTLRHAREGLFDVAICIFSSMGFHGRRTDRSVLRAVRQLVRPGGLMIFEAGDRDSILRQFQEVYVHRYAPNLELHEQRRFDQERSTMHSTWTFYRRQPQGHLRHLLESEISVRLYSLHELKELFQEAGWKYRRSYGDLATLSPVSFESRRLVVVSQRPGGGRR
jgi:SAM-dependent methyltransferase